MAPEIRYTLDIEPEEIPIRGNCSAIDPETDRETEKHILSELERGNLWAWCTVKVSAELEGFRGVSYLGACSYRSEGDFRSDGYFEDMKGEALEDLKSTIRRAISEGDHARAVLAELITQGRAI